MNEKEIYIYSKNRSIRSVITTGYRFFSAHFKALFAYSWTGAVVYALLTGSINTFYVTKYPYLLAVSAKAQINPYSVPENTLLTLGLLIACTIVLYFTFPLMASFGFSVGRYHQQQQAIPLKKKWYSVDGHSLWRTTKGYLAVTLLLAVVWGVVQTADAYLFSRLASVTRIVALSMLGIIAFVISLPLVAVGTQYVLGNEPFWSTLTRRYASAFRRWGMIFMTVMTDLLVALLLLFITTLPAMILLTAHIQAQEGALNGDPMGIPDHMGALTWIVFVIAAFIQAFVILLFLFPLYFMSGAIEQQESEKKQLISKLEEQ